MQLDLQVHQAELEVLEPLVQLVPKVSLVPLEEQVALVLQDQLAQVVALEVQGPLDSQVQVEQVEQQVEMV